jgi:hypothetical protein
VRARPGGVGEDELSRALAEGWGIEAWLGLKQTLASAAGFTNDC